MSDSLISKFSQMADVHQNQRFAKAMKEIGWKVIGKSRNYLYIKKVLFFTVAKFQHSNIFDLKKINEIRKKYHTLFTYVEPGLSAPDIGKIGIKVAPYAHSATGVVDLTLSKDELLKSFKSKTRYNISHTQRKNDLKIITKKFCDLTKSDLEIFLTSKIQWTKRKKICFTESFFKTLFKCFADSGWIHFAYYKGKCVGTLVILKNGKAAIYYAAFGEKQGYSLFAPTLLTWTAMTVAKENGCTVFDFGGIYDPRYRMYKKWVGFTKFKEGFSPTVVYFPPTQLLLGW